MENSTNPFLEKDKSIEITLNSKLPHWHQDDKIQFVTFRLADSLPQSILHEIKTVKSKFETDHPKPWDKSTTQSYHNIIAHKQEEYLNRGHGSCILKEKQCQQLLANTILHYDGIQYDTLAFVIMPNHVHLLTRPIATHNLSSIIQSIKRISSISINRLYNRHGSLWMKNYFDRIVRSHEHLKHCYHYIINNPKHLPEAEYFLYIKRY